MSARRAWLRLAALLAGVTLTAAASAQVVQGVQIGDVPASAPAVPEPVPAAQAIARAFIEACVLTEGDQVAAVDWAISQGFDPLDASDPNVEPLLSGKPGTVLAMPGQVAPVWLVAATGGPCTVWAERNSGEAVKLAFAQAVGQLVAKGAKLQPIRERDIERAGAWRHQSQWRYRRAGGTQDLGLDVVTTLSEQPGTQVLHLDRLSTPAAGFEPDGMPAR